MIMNIQKVMQEACEKVSINGGKPYGIICSEENAKGLIPWAMLHGYKVATSNNCPPDRIHVLNRQSFLLNIK